jgi:hypothetical protein
LKNPINGGTPASEKRNTVNKVTKKLSKLKVLKEYKVLIRELITESKIQKKPTNVRL